MVQNKKVDYQIESKSVRLISSSGENVGIVDKQVAINMAEEEGLNLVQFSQDRSNPVCKIIDYGKMKYKEGKNKKKNHHVSVTKEIRIGHGSSNGLNISDHDLQVKNKKARQFLDKGYKVLYVLRLKGRNRSMSDEAMVRFKEFVSPFSEIATWSAPSMSGSTISTVLLPNVSKT
jgi:translation initiation factor IF-3